MIIVGLCGRALFPALDDREVVLVRLAETLFPSVVAGVMLAAVLSAMMSTADSQLLVASGTVTHDLRLGSRPGRPPSLVPARTTVVVLTFSAALAALFGSERIFERVLFGWAALGAAFGPLLLVRVVLGRAIDLRRTFAVMLTGFVLAVGAYTVYPLLPLPGAYENVAIHVAPFVIALGLALGLSEPAGGRRAGLGPG
jgi:sodium/proline symporter